MDTKDLNIESLIEMNELLLSILDEIDVGIHVVNEKGETIIYNKRMMEIESMDSKDVLHKDLLDVFSFEKNQSSTLLEALRAGKVRKNIKQTYFNNKGKEITTINNTFPIKKNGTINGAVEIVEDITQLKKHIQTRVLQKQNSRYNFDNIIGDSEAMLSIIEESKKATRTPSSILIVGETGTGKEVFAQSIHNESGRANKPFISQNCAAIPESLMESILFGTKKGAFTGAMDKPGLFEEANGGTLLLDELNSLSPALQAKLLRVIQEKKIRRIGDIREIEIDVRIIATTNEDPIEAIANNRLRKDLYYRLSVVTLFLPTLRERREDILLLAYHFIGKYNRLFDMRVTDMDNSVKEVLHNHDWPGNVRELEHAIEGAMNLMEDERIMRVDHLPALLYRKVKHKAEQVPTAVHMDEDINQEDTSHTLKQLKYKIKETEEYYIKQALEESKGNIAQAAKALGMSRQSLQYRLRKYQI
ncbi:sigma-54 interaction domain-containing protein [Ectobacillus panaciterrae]|uniref:sigma-54 interaction domain-containing protein n=1 Tax=Ectobacillus panaciterrae TaxID=363872 RepID=UPI00041BC2AF|nr:sigma-54-dependent Fis family transcriptional regulator [Ectobacillus panaciterrae]